MYILGIHGSFGKSSHDSAAVLIKDSQVIAAAEEERFTRYKHSIGLMPDYAIKFCLKKAGVSMKDIDVVAFPAVSWFDFRPRLEAYLWYNFGYVPEIEYVNHHSAHAASCFLISGFPAALILTLDQSGDGVSCGIFRGKRNKIEEVGKIPFPHSLGLFAAFITQYLGFRSNHDEYKVMGLSAYGEANIDLSKLLTFKNGNLKFNESLLHVEVLKRHPVFHTKQLPMFKDTTYNFLPSRRLPGDVLTQEQRNLAASAQRTIEDAIFALINKYKTKDDLYLCIAGGVGENSVANGKIAESGLFEDIYVSPSCSDAGSALGAAIYSANKYGHVFQKVIDNKWGPSYKDSSIKKSLDSYKLKYKHSNSIAYDTAKLIASDKIVGWFQGRMEFGSRALGSRSIIADPSNKKMKNRVNRIKKREKFRPFAPAILNEHHRDLFTISQYSPFMSFTIPITQRGRIDMFSAIHIDKTARVQSVADDKSLFRELIDNYYKLTQIPAVLNTSFNSSWEPIVENPEQALAFFYSSEMDALAIGNFILEK